MDEQLIHAGCVIVGPIGLLIVGRSGAGKSALADVLVDTAVRKGQFGTLVSDDQTLLQRKRDILVGRPQERLAGFIEVRGLGIQLTAYEKSAAIRLVVELLPHDQLERLPETPLGTIEFLGVSVPKLQVIAGDSFAATRRIRWALRQLFPKSQDYV